MAQRSVLVVVVSNVAYGAEAMGETEVPSHGLPGNTGILGLFQSVLFQE